MSFSVAADELAVTQSAVSRHIRSLETYLGEPLFKRLTRAVELTATGERYAVAIQDVFDRLEEATKTFQSFERRRALVINTFPTFGMQFLVPRLGKFTLRYPEIETRLITSMEPVDFSTTQTDVGIRFEPPTNGKPRQSSASRFVGEETDLKMVAAWNGVRSELLLPGEMTPVCSAEFLQKFGPIETAADFCALPVIHNIAGGRTWRDWFRAYSLSFDQTKIVASFSHYFMALQAARDGLGVALVPAFEATDTDLVKLTDFTFKTGGGYYFLSREKEWDSEPVRLFREWIQKEFETANRPSDPD